jgi:glycosyltransferase involved in cell wall biosynthesis
VYISTRPGGGPYGYLYNLRQAVAEFGHASPIDFAVHVPSPVDRVLTAFRTKATSAFAGLRRRVGGGSAVPPPLETFEEAFAALWRSWKASYERVTDAMDAAALFECDFLCVHSTFIAERLVALYPEKAKERLILVPHAPAYYAYQVAGAVRPWADQAELYQERCVQETAAAELDIMQRARAVLWPFEGAQEGYPGWFERYKSGSATSVFAETGVPRPVARTAARQLREQWGIRPDQRLVLFIGRAHPHKGFPRFADWAERYRSRGEDHVVFVFAGPPPPPGRALSAILDVGWQDDPAAAYQAADLVVIPNTYSDLDIGLLQALSLGAPLAISATGGHRDFSRLCPDMPVIPDGTADAVLPVLERMLEDYAKDEGRRRAFVQLWQERFSLLPFVRNHAVLVQRPPLLKAPARRQVCTSTAVIFIGTGRYIDYFEKYYATTQALFLPQTRRTYFAITDQVAHPSVAGKHDVVTVSVPKEDWPLPTLLRFRYINGIADRLREFSHVVFMDADMVAASPVNEEEFFAHDKPLFGVQHPAFIRERGTFESNPRSLACVRRGEDVSRYYQGCFWGGQTEAVLALSRELARRIDEDLSRNVIAVWHDESHLNKYFIENRDKVHAYPPSYAYPETWQLPYEMKLVHLQKDYAHMRQVDSS